MVFSSLTFLFLFFPLVMGVYYLCPRALRNLWLLLTSLLFYAWGEPVYIRLMAASILFNYLCGLGVAALQKREKKRLAKGLLILCIAGNIGALGLFKYADLLIGTVNNIAGSKIALLELALPIGISFYTFQALSYVIDVYRGTVAAQKNPITFGTYIALFPQLIAGPIVQYKTVEEQLSHRRETTAQFAAGIGRFTIGLGKKVLIANQVGALWDTVAALPGTSLSAGTAWLGAIAFTFQIYFDFSGYSDMAIGLGKMLGFEFLENFDYPYLSRSITEYWRRWHISLGTWFREYVYPAGRQPVRPAPTDFESHRRVGVDRPVAWRQLELPAVGALLRCHSHHRKGVAAKAAAKSPRCGAAPLFPAADYPWLGHLCPDRFWGHRELFCGALWGARRRRCPNDVSADYQYLPAAGGSTGLYPLAGPCGK